MIYTKEDIHEFTCDRGVRWVHCPSGMLNVSVMDDGKHKHIRSTDMDSDMFSDGDSVCSGSSDTFRIDKYMGLDFVLVQKDYCTINEQTITLSGWDGAKLIVDKFGSLNHECVVDNDDYKIVGIQWCGESVQFVNAIWTPVSYVLVKTLSVSARSTPQYADKKPNITQCNHGCEACYTVCDKNRLICAIEDHFGVDLGSETESNKPVDLAVNLLANYKPKAN